MGRKGVSKRKPKQSRPLSNVDIGGSSKERPDDRSLVQSLVKERSAPLNRGGKDRPGGSNKHHNRGN